MDKASHAFETDRSQLSDEELLKELMTAYANELTNLAFSYIHDWGTAEDIVQDVFVKCFKKMTSFRGDSTYKTWLYRITINRCKDVMKSWAYRNVNLQAQESMFTLSSQEATPEEDVFQRSEQQELAQVVFQLPVKYREVILLHYYYDLKIDEISQMLKKNDKTVRTRLHRARKLLKQKLEEGSLNG